MYKILSILLLLAPLTLVAEIYKSVDSDGNVIYTDISSPEAELIPEPTPNTVQMPKPAPPAEKKGKSDKDTVYTSLQIVSPAVDETIHSNPGILSISLALTPELNIKAGDNVNILIDGQVLIKNSASLSAQIPDINRGSHRIQAVVANKEGATLIKSTEVQVFMQRQSVPEKAGANKPGPKDTKGNPVPPGPAGTYYKPGPVPPPKSTP